ncbi:hypothetical protein ACI2IY_15735 [Lysobacter enzymogenes]|uniref:hypothetical protein n=1 Tax=Lysobacter enzymogenes TaxID=69 RepID=UPI00384B73FC
MPFQLFRTDDRDPATIARDGFQAFAPMSADAARQFVARSVVDANTPLNLPAAAQRGVMADYFATNQGLVGLSTLYQEIRRETSHSSNKSSPLSRKATGCVRWQRCLKRPLRIRTRTRAARTQAAARAIADRFRAVPAARWRPACIAAAAAAA